MPLIAAGAIRVGPSISSEPVPIPGVIEQFDRIETLNLSPVKPCSKSMLFKRTLTNFMYQTGIGFNIMGPVVKGEVSYKRAIEQGIFQKLRDLVSKYEVINEFEKVVNVPIADIHCPHVTGCKATYIHETKRKNQHFLKVTVFGFGGGTGISMAIGTGYAISAKEKCMRVSMPVKVKVQKKKPYRGEPFISVDVIGRLGGYSVSAIREKHACGKNYNRIERSNKRHERYRLGARGTYKANKLIGIGKKSDFFIKFPLIGAEPILMNSVEVLKEIKYDYELAGQYDYLGYFPAPTSSIFCWTWKNKEVK